MIKLGIGCAQIVGDAGLGCGSSSGGITGGNTNIYAGGAAAAAGCYVSLLVRLTLAVELDCWLATASRRVVGCYTRAQLQAKQ